MSSPTSLLPTWVGPILQACSGHFSVGSGLAGTPFTHFLGSNNKKRKKKGMSGGVGPTGGDIRLAGEEVEEAEQVVHAHGALKPPPPPRRRYLSLRQLNALALIVVLSASGLVATEDLAFFVFSLAYVHFLSRFAFPSQTPGPEPPVFGERNRALGTYVLVGAVVGLVLPVAYIFEGVAEGDKPGVAAAAPHVFLLASQVFMEGVTFAGGFSLPVRVFVPVLYNTRRIFAIMEWLRAEVGKVEGEHGSAWRVRVGRGLAVANLLFWGFNLFGFLLPVYLPRALKKYYGQKAKA